MAVIHVLDRTPVENASESSIGRYAALTLIATGLVALAAHVSVPLFFTPVPLTLQTLVVLFLGLLLGPRWAFITLSVYLAEGAAGLPVFSPAGPGGVAQLIGPTGGYLLSYPFAAAAAGLLCRVFERWFGLWAGSRFTGATLLPALLSALLGSVLILAAGASWLEAVTHLPAQMVLAKAVLPFIAGDLIKVSLAASAYAGLRRLAPFRPARPGI